MPLFSIITPTLNASLTLDDAVRSALGQGTDFEHLIMDGCSTDETVTIARTFPHLNLHIAKDRGLYDAMNKGASLAQGEWLIFLQADDWIPPGALKAIATAINANPQAEIITGSSEAVQLGIDQHWKSRWKRHALSDKALTVERILFGDPMINARAIRKTLFDQVGPFNLLYSLASDRDFLLRLVQVQPRAAIIEHPTYLYRWHDDSRTMNEGNSLSPQLNNENLSIAEQHLWKTTEPSQAILFREWHSGQSIQAALCALEAFDFPLFFQSAARAVRVNHLWPLKFLKEFTRSLLGYLRRGCITRSQMHLKTTT